MEEVRIRIFTDPYSRIFYAVAVLDILLFLQTLKVKKYYKIQFAFVSD